MIKVTIKNISRLVRLTGSAVFAFAFSFCCTLLADNAEANKSFQLGLEKFQKGEYSKAAKDFEAAQIYADDVGIKANSLKQAAKCYAQADQKYKEFECLEKLINGFPSYINFAETVDREYDLGDKFFIGETDPAFEWIPWLRDTSKAQEVYEKALKHAPYAKKAAESKLRLGRLYIDASKSAQAIKTFRELIKMYPNTIQQKYAYLELANVLIQLARFGDGDGKYGREAKEVLLKFKAKYPKDKEIGWVDVKILEVNDITANRLYSIARFYHKLDRDEPASRYLNDVLKEYPDAEKSDDSEQLLADIDSEYSLPLEKPDKPRKYELFKREPLPAEDNQIIAVPENSEGKWLLPIRDTGLEYKDSIKPIMTKSVNTISITTPSPASITDAQDKPLKIDSKDPDAIKEAVDEGKLPPPQAPEIPKPVTFVGKPSEPAPKPAGTNDDMDKTAADSVKDTTAADTNSSDEAKPEKEKTQGLKPESETRFILNQ